jgi:hypothetical protein
VVKSKAVRAESIWAAIGGALTGYVAWLVAISIGDALTTVSLWGLVLLIVSVASAVAALLWGRRLRRRGNVTLASFAFALPALPVLLSLGVLVRMYF